LDPPEPDLNLPDLLTMRNGERVTTAAQWQQARRPEILELFRTHVYGRAPLGRPPEMTFDLLESDPLALGGRATRKQVRINFTPGRRGQHADLLIYLPNGTPQPVGLFAGLNFGGNSAIHPDPAILDSGSLTPWGHSPRGANASRWPVEAILARGYGLATLHNHDIDPDEDDGFRNGVHGAFDPLYYPRGRPPDAWGTVAAWAWGLSRALDYLESDPQVDPSCLVVLGHSRLGKTALWCGAQDPRWAIVISNDSGCTGAALARRKLGEGVKDINTHFPHWFCRNYRNYNDHEEALPVDQHMLIALMAPRPVYIASASLDAHADPPGEFLAGVYAAPAYSLFGLPGLESEHMPPPGHPLGSGYIGYHLRAGAHDLTSYDWGCFMDFADRHFARRHQAG
jgi:hypothetical protein